MFYVDKINYISCSYHQNQPPPFQNQTDGLCVQQVCSACYVYLHTHTLTKTYTVSALSSDANPFSCDANTCQGWLPRDKFNADRYIPPLACHQQTHLVFFSASTCFGGPPVLNLSVIPVTFLTPSNSRGTASKTQVELGWIWRQDRLYFFHMWFK